MAIGHILMISLRFLGIILRVLRLEVSVYNVYITNQFHFARGGGGGGGYKRWYMGGEKLCGKLIGLIVKMLKI